MSSSATPRLRLPNRTAVVVTGITVGVALLGFLLRRWFKGGTHSPKANNVLASAIRPSTSMEMDGSQRPDSVSGRTQSRMRGPGSVSDRGSVRQSRQRSQYSTSLPPLEADLLMGMETCQELMRNMERALSSLELVKNRSEKDRGRVEMLSSVIDRLRILETDVTRLVSDGGFDDIREEGGGLGTTVSSSNWSAYQSPRAGTLSVLSDDSFMSALEDFAVTLEEDEFLPDAEAMAGEKLIFLQLGMQAAIGGEVSYRKSRTDFCQCENETEFAAKVWCLRQAFAMVLKDEHRRVWLGKAGRSLLADILKHSKQDPSQFYKAFDEMMLFFSKESNLDQMEKELASRGVIDFGFYDVVLDFILLDSFDDLKSPPSAIYSVTKNFFLSHSMKYSTISTIIWSMLKAKRQRLQNPNGFIAHFYNISEAVSPAITLGFLGTDGRIGELCQYFKEQITQFVIDVFNQRKVRYTRLEDLAEDIWIILQNRTEAVQSRLSTELIPV